MLGKLGIVLEIYNLQVLVGRIMTIFIIINDYIHHFYEIKIIKFMKCYSDAEYSFVYVNKQMVNT